MLGFSTVQLLIAFAIIAYSYNARAQKNMLRLAIDPEFRAERDAREARKLAVLNTENAARVHAIQEADKANWIRARREAERLATLRGEKFTPWVEK